MLCILYVIAFGTVLSGIGALFDYGLPRNIPRRAIWSVTMLGTIIVPGMFAFTHRTTPGIDVWGMQIAGFTTHNLASAWTPDRNTRPSSRVYRSLS